VEAASRLSIATDEINPMADFRAYITLVTRASVDILISRLVLAGYTVSSLDEVPKSQYSDMAALQVTPPNPGIDEDACLTGIKKVLTENKRSWHSIVVTGTVTNAWCQSFCGGQYFDEPEEREILTPLERMDKELG
jgi:hypothetical protein